MAKQTDGERLYESANGARRKGDHDAYIALIGDLIAYNARQAAAMRDAHSPAA